MVATNRARSTRHAIPSRQRGFALLMVLLLSVVSLMIGMYAAMGARTEMALAHNDLLIKQALNVAQAGLNHAVRVISNHNVADDELAANSGGTCTGNGVGNASSGIATIGNLASLNGACYRFREFGPDTGDGYYIVVSDNHDDGSAADDQLHDKDLTLRVTSIGVVGTAVRTMRMTVTGAADWGFYGVTKVTLSGGSTTDSFSGPYSAGTAQSTSRVGSNGNIALSGGSTTIGGNALAGGAVTTSGGSSVTGTTTNGAPAQTFAAAPTCTPFSNNAGITPSSVYNSTTGSLTVGGGGTVTLTPGTYCFSDFKLSGGSTLIINGMTTLNITGKFDSSGGSVSNTLLDAYSLKVNVGGGADVKLSGGSGTYMLLYAPESKVDVSGGGAYFGTIVADQLTASGGSALHQQRNANSLWAMSATHEIR